MAKTSMAITSEEMITIRMIKIESQLNTNLHFQMVTKMSIERTTNLLIKFINLMEIWEICLIVPNRESTELWMTDQTRDLTGMVTIKLQLII